MTHTPPPPAPALRRARRRTRPALLLTLAMTTRATAELVVSANDGKQVLVDGQQRVPAAPAADTLSIIDWTSGRVHVVATVAVPASVIGPPRSVAVTPDGAYAIVTSARRLSGDGGAIVPDDRVSVVDIARARVVQTVQAGAGASGVAINPAGTRVLVANRATGTLSLFAFARGRLAAIATVPLGDAGSSPAQPLFYADGARALVTRDGDHRVAVVAVDGAGMRVLARTLASGLRPYAIDAAGARRVAVVGNIGGGGRDVDTLSLIDLTGAEPVVVDTVAAGLTPEGVRVSPDARFVAATVNNGSNAAPTSPAFAEHGLLRVWRIAGGQLIPVASAPMGAWGQGIVWSRDSRHLLAQAMVGDRLERFRFDGRAVCREGEVALPGGPAAIATAG